MSIEAMKQALEALEIAAKGGGVNFYAYAEELRQAIAEEEKQEPVAWMWKDETITTDPDRADGTWTPLYTHPQPKREPLTDEQIAPMFAKRQSQETIGEKDAWYFYAWGVNDGEAAHGIKGEA